MTTVQDTICTGDAIGSEAAFTPGFGTYTFESQIYASLTGVRQLSEAAQQSTRPTVTVQRTAKALVPQAGHIVTVRVTRVTSRVATCEILCVGAQPLNAGFTGIIRSQDVRGTAVDSVVLADCYRPGDIVLAQVLAAGDSRSYFLSTAQEHLGVVAAKSGAGGSLVPAGPSDMQCSLTGVTEKRKVAQPAAQ